MKRVFNRQSAFEIFFCMVDPLSTKVASYQIWLEAPTHQRAKTNRKIHPSWDRQ